MLLALASCGGPDTEGTQPEATRPASDPKVTLESRPGSPAVYERIAKTTDCTELQMEFDRTAQTSKRPGGHRVLVGQ